MTELSEDAILERLRLHPAVRSASVLPHEPPKTIGGLQCRLWCRGCAVRSSGTENVQFTATRTTLAACLAELEKKLSKHGAECETRAAAAKAAAEQQQSSRAGSSGTAEAMPPDVMRAMMGLARAETRAKAAEDAAREAGAVALAALEPLQRCEQLGPVAEARGWQGPALDLHSEAGTRLYTCNSP